MRTNMALFLCDSCQDAYFTATELFKAKAIDGWTCYKCTPPGKAKGPSLADCLLENPEKLKHVLGIKNET